MGVVYKGHDRHLGRTVAIKVLPAEFSHDTQFLQRFKNEILNSARLDHPHIVQVYDVGEDAGVHFFIMQMVAGTDLHHQIQRQGCYPVADAVEILLQIAKALDYAHQHGVVHRDIKPDNILIDQSGIARVVDFGIARTMEGTRMTGGMLGTPEYMSPEQARGEDLDGRSDQYSLALVAYEMLTGTTPFRSSTAQPWAIVNMHLTVPPPDPRQYIAMLPAPAVNALMQGLAKVPAYRFATCVEFVQALQNLALAAAPIASRSRSLVPLVVLCIVFAILGVGGVMLSQLPVSKSWNIFRTAEPLTSKPGAGTSGLERNAVTGQTGATPSVLSGKITDKQTSTMPGGKTGAMPGNNGNPLGDAHGQMLNPGNSPFVDPGAPSAGWAPPGAPAAKPLTAEAPAPVAAPAVAPMPEYDYSRSKPVASPATKTAPTAKVRGRSGGDVYGYSSGY